MSLFIKNPDHFKTHTFCLMYCSGVGLMTLAQPGYTFLPSEACYFIKVWVWFETGYFASHQQNFL